MAQKSSRKTITGSFESQHYPGNPLIVIFLAGPDVVNAMSDMDFEKVKLSVSILLDFKLIFTFSS